MDNSISLDMSREAQSDRRIIKNNEEIVEGTQNDMVINPVTSHKSPSRPQGKMIIISDKLNISLGPHYPFFIIGFIMVLTVSSLLVYCSFTLIKSQQKGATIIRVISTILCLWVNIAYLISALSDPGIYMGQKSSQNGLTSGDNSRNCSACKIQVPSNVRHCFTCDVCIEGLDHHCPWMSKCVGKNNLVPFYAFLGGLFLTMGLFWVTLYLILSK